MGRVHFLTETCIIYKTYVTGSYFGEIEIIKKGCRMRKHTICADKNVETLTLMKTMYNKIIEQEYPQIHEEMKSVSILRKRKLKIDEAIFQQKIDNKDLQKKVFYEEKFSNNKHQDSSSSEEENEDFSIEQSFSEQGSMQLSYLKKKKSENFNSPNPNFIKKEDKKPSTPPSIICKISGTQKRACISL